MTDRLYRVLKRGVYQRNPRFGSAPDEPEFLSREIGERINVSDVGAEPLVREGFIELAPETEPPATPQPARSRAGRARRGEQEGA